MKPEREKLLECLQLARSAGDRRLAIQALVHLSDLDQAEGHMRQAIEHLLSALSDSLDTSDKQAVEFCFGKLGLVYLADGQYEKAAECFRNALDHGVDSPNKIAWTGSLGQSLAELGQYDEALACFVEVLQGAKQEGDIVSQSICLGSTGNLQYEQNRLSEADKNYQQALAMSVEAGDERLQAIWQGNIASTKAKLGDADAAIEACKQALSFAQASGDKALEAAHLDTIGDCYMVKGEAQTASQFYKQALELSQSIGWSPFERVYLGNLARAEFRLGNNNAAYDLFSEAIDQFDSQRSNLRSDFLKTSFSTRGHDLYKDMIELCLKDGKRVEALEYISRSKSRAMLDLLGNSPIDISDLSNAVDESLTKLIAQEKDLREQIRHLERVFGDGTGNESRGGDVSVPDMNTLYTQWRQTIEQLKSRHPNYANMVSVNALSFSEMQTLWQENLLANDMALIEYFVTEKYLLAMAVWKGANEPAYFILQDSDELKALNKDLKTFLEMVSTEGWQVPASLSKRIYEKLFAPLANDIPANISSLIIVPHESLYHVPFAALHDGSGYLVEKWTISHLPSTSLIPILKNRTIGKDNLRYLLSTVSDYSATRNSLLIPNSDLRSSSGFNDLTHAKQEAQNVLSITKEEKTTVISDKEVGKLLPRLFNQHEVVHFAGHAVFHPDQPLASGLVMSDGHVLTAASILNSGILRTKNGKLMVLSACQTGLNQVTSGGEIIGLTRALMYAGMPNLILSLWEVADESTAKLMQSFYQAWQGGVISVAKALQEAQIKGLKEGLAPHAWAPFIHIGIE